jgi:DNA-binding beta-propeller fold protein YncE
MRHGSTVAVLLLALAAWGCSAGHNHAASTTSDAVVKTPRRSAHPSVRLVFRAVGSLGAPLQDAAAAPLGDGRFVLLGGLDVGDASTDGIHVVAGSRELTRGALPGVLHDAAAVGLGGAAYLFGGGNSVQQLAGILRVDPRTGAAHQVGSLPAPSSDSAAAALNGTAYVVGGYTGTRWLDTIIAWRPGTTARVVARLPTPLRYAAVAADHDEIVIAGGSTPAGTASRAVYSFDPSSGHVRLVGRLPHPTTHAAAASLGELTYVIGGRGATVDTPTRRVIAVDPEHGRVVAAGRLSMPLSDLAAASIGHGRIAIAGGHGVHGTVATVAQLVPATRAGDSPKASVLPNVYANDRAGMLSSVARRARPLIYVPNSLSNTVDEIDPRTFRVVRQFAVGALPQHVTPSWDLKTLYVLNDLGNSLTAINPATGAPTRTIPVDDPYNMYFTPDGRYAIVVAERLARLDFRDAHTFRLHRSVQVPCRGVDHMDFSADGTYAVASCEFSGALVKIDIARQRIARIMYLPVGSEPQDVKLSPDGRVFYVADMGRGGVWEIDGRRWLILGFLRTGAGAHGLYASRNTRYLYVTNRAEGSISVVSFRTRRVVRKWVIPGGGSPDMGNVSADGRVLWLSGRWNDVVYAIDTRNGKLLAKIPVGHSPHGLCVWPQPGRYSLGHTGILR